MINENDYNTIMNAWVGYLNSQCINSKNNLIYDSIVIKKAKCTADEFTHTVNMLITLASKENDIQKVINTAHYRWMSSDDMYDIGIGLWRVLSLNARSSMDFVFADDRACLAFYLVFGTLKRFLNAKLEEKDDYYSNAFVKNYLSCNVNDYQDVIKNNRILFAPLRTYPCTQQKVCFVGDTSTAKIIADSFYGVGKYVVYRSDIDGAIDEIKTVKQSRAKYFNQKKTLTLSDEEKDKRTQESSELLDKFLKELKHE